MHPEKTRERAGGGFGLTLNSIARVLRRSTNRGVGRGLLSDVTGQALWETALVLPVLIVMLMGVLVLGPLAYVRLAVDAASYDCITAAVEAVSDESQARYQGRIAANQTLDGFRVNPGNASVHIWTNGPWGPGAQTVCRVSFDFAALNIPWASTFGAPGTIAGETALEVQTHKSDWW